MPLEGFRPYEKEDVEKYDRLRWWAGLTFGDILDKAADIYPDKEALVDGKERFTYSHVRDKVNRLAVSLIGLGLKPLDRVMVQLPNWHEFVFAYFALQKIGTIPVLILPRHREYEINHIAGLTEAVAWILPEKHKGTNYGPILQSVLQTNHRLRYPIVARGKGPGGSLGLHELMEDTGPVEEDLELLARRRPDPMEVAHMGPTGGTTGLPKVVPRTHNDYLCRVEYLARAWELGSDDTLLLVAPVTHDLTFSVGLCSALFTFGRMVMLDDTEAESICRIIEEERITAIPWTPTLAYRLLHHERLHDFDLSSFQKMYCGGGMSSPEFIRTASEKLGCRVLNGYGGTEGMSTLPRLHDDLERKCLTVGRPTCPYDIYRIVDTEGRKLPPNVPGELAVKGPGVFTGYYKMPAENAKAFDREGFFRTGDQAMINEAGDLVLTGRLKDIIIRGGENISPVEIENLIMAHPDVEAVAVVGMPDPVMGEKACAYIQPRQGKQVRLEDIKAFLKTRGASVLQYPERVETVDVLPVVGGKALVDKKALREDIRKKLGTA